MKFFAFIMAFLVIALSVMPCADGGKVMIDGKGKIEVTKTSNQQDDQQQDGCSPFCTCTCCAGFSINHFIAAISTIPSYERKLVAGLLSFNIIEVALPVWQPPQII